MPFKVVDINLSRPQEAGSPASESPHAGDLITCFLRGRMVHTTVKAVLHAKDNSRMTSFEVRAPSSDPMSTAVLLLEDEGIEWCRALTQIRALLAARALRTEAL